MMRIFIINGSGGSGKDTFVNLCQIYADLFSLAKIYNYSTITPIKELAKKIGWDGSKTNKDRKFLSDLKDLLTEYNDYSYTYIESIIKTHKRIELPIPKILFIHCREPKEIQRFVDNYKAKTILIKRPKIEIANNHADMEVENFNYDFIINNDEGLDTLSLKAKHFINTILKIEEKD